MGIPPLVAIVGRPNVGKSTLFNRMIRRRQAVVDVQPGVTRDRIYARAEWAGRTFRVVDTGGLVPDSKDPLEKAIHAQADVAIQESVLILFVVDVETGPTDLDVAVSGQLRRSDRPVVLVVNKVDNEQRTLEVPAFYQLGLGEPRWVSAISGRGTGDLLDVVVAGLPPASEDEGAEYPAGAPLEEPGADEELEEDEEALMTLWESDAGERADDDDGESDGGGAPEPPDAEAPEEQPGPPEGPLAPLQIAVLGRPNVGKSSFVNAVYGSERVIVSEVAGTTRDPADIEVTVDGRQLTLVDTAGLRRRTRVKENVEYYSALRAYQSLDRCDVALLMVDAVEGITHQEARLLERILARGKAAVLLVNKWDLVEKETGTAEAYEKRFREEYPFAYYVPVLFLSALTGQRVDRALQFAIAAGEARRRRVRTSRFNTFLTETVRGRRTLTPAMGDLKVSYALQSGIEPPTFLFFVNDPKKLKPNFRRYLERRIRQAFELEGTPVRLRFRAKA